jgi:hypothetical protein
MAPAFLMIFASPFLNPIAFGSNSNSRVSMHVMMTIFLSGYFVV